MNLRILIMISVGALIGWITNFIAIRMLFRPYKAIGIGPFKIQGLIPKRKHELALGIADTVESELLSLDDIKEKIRKSDIEGKLGPIIDKILDEKFEKMILKYFPMLAVLLSGATLDKIKVTIRNAILENKDEIINAFAAHMENIIDIREMITQKVDDLSLDRLEKVTYALTKKELGYIELIGAILGAVIGALQYVITLYI